MGIEKIRQSVVRYSEKEGNSNLYKLQSSFSNIEGKV